MMGQPLRRPEHNDYSRSPPTGVAPRTEGAPGRPLRTRSITAALSLLLQLEQSGKRGVVLRGHGHAVAATLFLRRLPVVDELPASGVVPEARAAGRGERDVIHRSRC